MTTDLQKPGMWKRISAWLLDIILLATMVVGIWWGLNALFRYDDYLDTYTKASEFYAQKHGYDLSLTEEDVELMTEQEREEAMKKAEAVNQDMNADEEVVHAWNMMVSLSLLSVTLSVFFSMLLLEFVVPLLFGNGQTLGKKVFSIAITRIDSVQIKPLQLAMRTFLGKFTVETMLPIYLVILAMSGYGLTMSLIALVIMTAQILAPMLSRDDRALHDYIAGTMAVDIHSQRIFRTPQDLVDYKTKLHAEAVARRGY